MSSQNKIKNNKKKKLSYPFYKCMICNHDIAEMEFPIHPKQQYPKCPICHSNDKVDIVLGNEDTILGDEDMVIGQGLSLDTVIFSDNIIGSAEKGCDDNGG